MNEEPNSTQKMPIETAFESPQTVDIAVVTKATENAKNAKAIRKAKRLAAISELAEYEKMGVKILKTKVKVAAAVGAFAETANVKHIGHGKLAAAADNADEAIEELDEIIQQVKSKGDVDNEMLLGLLQLKLGFNKQLVDIGDRHIAASKDVGSESKANELRVPFPSGQPVTVAITNQPVSKPLQVEDSTPTQ